MTHCGRLAPTHPPPAASALLPVTIQVLLSGARGEKRTRVRQRTHTNTQHFFFFRMGLDVHKCVKWRRQLTLKADRSISSRLRAGESLAMMEDTKRHSQLPRYPQTAFAVTTMWSSLPLGFSLSCTVMSQRWTKLTVASQWSAAGRVSGRERTARARTRGRWEASAPCAVAPSGPCRRGVDGTEER